MTSASPSAIIRLASPIACAPVEQAVTTEWFGPLNRKRIETWPLTRLIRLAGMKNGLTRRGPRCSSSTAVSAIVPRPPMPEPIRTPVRSRSRSSCGIQSASSTASRAAAMPYRMKGSFLRTSLGSSTSSARKAPSPSVGTWPAILAGRSSTSNLVIRRMPLSPPIRRRQTRSTPQPSGVTRPRPVTTTRLIAYPKSPGPNPTASGPTCSGRDLPPRAAG